ncbi:MAG: acyltransferase [Nostoc sp. NMS1]|uniref:acyltransferase family protein n=1 Tax=unclassified Nostoc TaxID=2593658 RepID=UPI0025ED8B9D|nr:MULTISPECIES: acyltransferase [unclassified Nostoc]MBN3907814.1 acyltransferase [Nostoc sp. NMS1]MBN3991175.1 acyltransferase [Nostoc sp. NMS2]
MPKTSMYNQINSLTSLRGIAALVVVVHHFSYYTLPKTGSTLSAYSDFFRNGYLCVDFFFILSGFIMTHVYIGDFSLKVNSSNYRSYLFSRFARIYPLHIFVLSLFIGLEIAKIFLLNNSAFTGKFNLTALFANIFLLQAFDLTCPPLFWCDTYWNEPAWSISVEFVIYCIFPFILFLLLRNNEKNDLKIYVSALFSILLLIAFTRGNLDSIIGIPSIARCGLECILGIITYKVYRRDNYRKYFNINLLAIIAITWIILIMNYYWNYWRSLHDWLILPAFSLLILAVSINNSGAMSKFLNSRLMLYFGTISYSIYMVHWFVQELLKTLWIYKFHHAFGKRFTEYEALTSLGVFLMIIILAASLTYRFVEVPMRNYLKSTILAKQ